MQPVRRSTPNPDSLAPNPTATTLVLIEDLLLEPAINRHGADLEQYSEWDLDAFPCTGHRELRPSLSLLYRRRRGSVPIVTSMIVTPSGGGGGCGGEGGYTSGLLLLLLLDRRTGGGGGDASLLPQLLETLLAGARRAAHDSGYGRVVDGELVHREDREQQLLVRGC